MKAKQTTLTPALAQALLNKNPNNRSLSIARAKVLAASIARGEWMANGESIIVDADGNLLDGQHRCLAVILADQPISTLLVEGVDSAAFATIDLGKQRSSSDLLAISGEAQSHDLSSAITTLDMILNDRPRRERLTFLQRKSFLAQHPELRRSVEIVQCGNFIARSVAAAVHYLSAKKHGETFADKWIRDLNALKFDEPQRLFARALQNARSAGTRVTDARWVCGLALKSIRASHTNSGLRFLKFGDEETYPVL
jgi:hypothetical protein